MFDDNKVTYFAETDSRNKRVPFGIKRGDRSRHMYLIGKTGMGKSTLLENLAVQDIRNGEGFAFIDPHGKSADLLLEYIPQERIKDVLYFAPFDMEHPVSFNVMEDVGPDRRHLVANGLMSAFKKIWVDAWSARMEYILNNILLALLEYPDSTLLGVNRMLADKDFRKKVVDNITDPSVKAFWTDEYAKYTDKFAAEAAPAIQNKIGQFISNPLVRNIIGQPKSTFDVRKLMDQRKIVIINLSKGRMGESNANLLGSMLITKIYLGAMSRADLNDEQLSKSPNFYLYVDEFQNFANESFADILSEARKYKLNLTVAHQYIEQMSEEVRAAVFGNVGTMVTFRVGAYDAEVLEKEFAPTFMAEDLVNLGRFQFYIKLMIDGVSSPPFSATSMGPLKKEPISHVPDIIQSSRSTYARTRNMVEEDIKNWHAPIGSQPVSSATTMSQAQAFIATSQPRPAPTTTPRPLSAGPAISSSSAGVSSQSRPAVVSQPASNTSQAQRSVQPSQSSSRETSHNQNTSRPPERSRSSDQQPNTARATMEIPRDRRAARVSRETELRKAMSLDYLKPQVEPESKKIPTAKNVSQLRDALLSVLKDVENPDESKVPVSASIPAKPTSVQSVQSPQTKHIQFTVPQAVSTPPKPVIALQEAPKAENKASLPSEPKKAKEVPEDVLRKILHVDML